jgi:hypothetical protein
MILNGIDHRGQLKYNQEALLSCHTSMILEMLHGIIEEEIFISGF